ncbi:GNAT family N-acetyltransferase [Paenibacillus sp. GP183]|jgi:N-acetylglutamate synthase|uniref:GNAT family N-acetyltransferase n=1 Tax=Paenibacillus sp. GP183 TaxID=1882751 RepID=UPI0008956D0A|nr:GNAT family N-acetyltransferase [Paenibacillus sp. GP183]SED09754.1 N-acetylglutamate synthase [Paenibacillus sp. GP183]
MYEIKAMTIQDYEGVSKFWSEVKEFTISLEFDSKNRIDSYLRRNPGFSSIAYFNGEVVGTVLCGHDGRRGSLYHVVVSKDHRKMGLSKQMIERCINCLTEAGIDNGFLFVSTKDENALSFWNHNGWRPFTEVVYHYKNFD